MNITEQQALTYSNFKKMLATNNKLGYEVHEALTVANQKNDIVYYGADDDGFVCFVAVDESNGLAAVTSFYEANDLFLEDYAIVLHDGELKSGHEVDGFYI